MTDEDIQKAWRDIGGADGRMILPLYAFARALIAQARAELIAEMRQRITSRAVAGAILSEDVLAIIPDTKE